MATLGRPCLLTVGLQKADQIQILQGLTGHFFITQADRIEQALALNLIPDTVIIPEDLLRSQSPEIKSSARESPIVVVSPLDVPVFSYQLKTPIDSDELMRVVVRAAGDAMKPKVNWGQLVRGSVVTSRVTPGWSQGVVVECIDADYCLVLFPKAKAPFNARPVRCHVTALKMIQNSALNDFDINSLEKSPR